MIDYKISKSDIYMAEIAMYTYGDESYLNVVDLGFDETFRKVAVVNNIILDFETGCVIPALKTEGLLIDGDVYENTMYCLELIKIDEKDVTDEELLYAARLYEEFLEQQKLIKERKIIPFPRRKLH